MKLSDSSGSDSVALITALNDSDFLFSQDHRRSYDSVYNFDSDSGAGHPWRPSL